MKKFALLLGPPGSGARTQTRYLEDVAGLRCIRLHDVLQQERISGSDKGQLIGEMLDNNGEVPPEIVGELLKAQLEGLMSTEHAVVHGWPMDADSAAVCATIAGRPALAVLLKCHSAAAAARVGVSGGAIVDTDAAMARVLAWEESLQATLDALRSMDMVNVDAEQSPDVVFADVQTALCKLWGDLVPRELNAPPTSTAVADAPFSATATSSSAPAITEDVATGTSTADEPVDSLADGQGHQGPGVGRMAQHTAPERAEDAGAPAASSSAAPGTSIVEPSLLDADPNVSTLSSPDHGTRAGSTKEQQPVNSAFSAAGKVDLFSDAVVVSPQAGASAAVAAVPSPAARIDADGSTTSTPPPPSLPSNVPAPTPISASLPSPRLHPSNLAVAAARRVPLAAVVLVGPSGVGKGTLAAELMRREPGHFGFTVSHTTRAPRPGERDGEHYHFVSRAAFEAALARGEFLEHAAVHGELYGTSADAVEAVRRAGGTGRIALLDIDVQGAQQVRRSMLGTAALIAFIEPPSPAELERRLRCRGTEDEERIQARLAAAEAELNASRAPGLVDVRIVNDDVASAVHALSSAISAREVPTQYITRTAASYLCGAMKALNAARPEDPLSFIIDHLVHVREHERGVAGATFGTQAATTGGTDEAQESAARLS